LNYYRGNITSDISKNYASATDEASNALARQGVDQTSGAAIETMSDLNRGKTQDLATGYSNLQGMDIGQKQANLDNLMKLFGVSTLGGTSGSTTTTSGGNTTSGLSSLLKGAIGGASAGTAISPGWGTAIGGVLGGLGGLF